MRDIAELSLLLRVQAELPAGLKLTTEEFREGWNFVRAGDAHRLGVKIQARGWSFIKIADRVARIQSESGVDEKEALKRLARERGQSKSEVYRELQRERARRRPGS